MQRILSSSPPPPIIPPHPSRVILFSPLSSPPPPPPPPPPLYGIASLQICVRFVDPSLMSAGTLSAVHGGIGMILPLVDLPLVCSTHQ